MPIINNFTGGEVEITKLADILTGTDYDITDVYYGDKHIFTVWGESEGALPRTFNANGDNAVEWQVWGNVDPNANLFDERWLVNNNWYFDNHAIKSVNPNLDARSWNYNAAQFKFNLMKGTYSITIISLIVPTIQWSGAALYSNTNTKIFETKSGYDTGNSHSYTFTLSDSTELGLMIKVYDGAFYIMLVKGSTAPSSYTPYSDSDRVGQRTENGFKIPMAVGDGTLSLYIGSTPLDEGEYTSYADQKIYKYVSGVLTPTDPPVPIPALPTLDGTTVVDTELASSEVQPEKVYIKYRKDDT